MIMEAMARNWTDERLEERFDRIDQRFDEVDRRLDAIDRRFEQVDRRFEQVDRRFEQIDHRFDATQRLIIQVGGGIIATVLMGFLGLIATQL